jgi:GTP-binding protein
LILFVVDAPEGLTPVDQTLAAYLRKAEKPVYVLVNKVDESGHEGLADEFAALGFETMFTVSAAHNRGIRDIVHAVDQALPAPSEEETAARLKRPIRIAVVGRPNVGKSSLVNSLLEDDRSIVSDVPGTTRDAVDIPFEHGGLDYIFIDTAGLRARNKQDTSVEIFSGMRSKAGIRRADLCVLVIDAAQGPTAMDRKIAGMIAEAGKPCVIVVNKFDLYHPDAPKSDRLEALQEEVSEGLFFIPYAPVVATSAKTGESVRRLFFATEQVRKASWAGLGTGALNRLLQGALAQKPPPSGKGGKRFKLLYATMAQVKDGERPIPVADFILFCNKSSLLPQSYMRYLESRIRSECEYTGIPIRFVFRERETRGKR